MKKKKKKNKKRNKNQAMEGGWRIIVPVISPPREKRNRKNIASRRGSYSNPLPIGRSFYVTNAFTRARGVYRSNKIND